MTNELLIPNDPIKFKMTPVKFSPVELLSGHKRCLFLLFCTLCYVAYIAMGGLCFLLIEGPQEDALYQRMHVAKANIIQKHPGVTEEALDEFLMQVTSFRVRGVVAVNTTKRWTYSESVFFTVTLLTTIGYGHVTPISQVGKAFCMIYSAFGIPFTLLLLAAYVQRLMHLSESYKKMLFSQLEHLLKPVAIHFLHVSTIMASILVLCFLLPAMLFAYLEDGWTYLDATYFCFISLTTVGLGDLVPSLKLEKRWGDIYRYGVSVYVVVGVMTMMFMMSLSSDFQQSISRSQTEILPTTVKSEKIPINNNTQDYGSILVCNSKITRK